MYWPIGAPNVYALSKQETGKRNILQSDDGLEKTEAVSEKSEDSTEHSADLGVAPQPDAGGKDGTDTAAKESEIIDAKISRGGAVFVTITRSALTVWQAKPVLALTGVVRSPQSMQLYGTNTTLLLKPDGLTLVVQTALGYLITYTINTDPSAKVYRTHIPETNKHARRLSQDGFKQLRKSSIQNAGLAPGEGEGIREVHVRFRMVIRIDAGISKALALDDELIVATQKPSALQCIRWVAENGISQTSTELVSRMSWIGRKIAIVEMIYDRPMNLSTWITSDGRAYAVQRRRSEDMKAENSKSLFQGFCFREPELENDAAVKVAINARFSLIAVGCVDGHIDVYTVKDYMGNIPLSHKLRLPVTSTGHGGITFLSYSPDGYCVFVGYERGWAIWSVFGKLVTSTFGADRALTKSNDDRWLGGIQSAFWVGNGCELVLLPVEDDRLWVIEMARNALTGCFMAPNISRGLLQSSNSVMLYKGHDVADITSLPSDMPLWQTIQIPPTYLVHQWPIKSSAVSSDGRYIAVAGRRGLAHYSVASAKWKTFDDPEAENEFSVRGGMCWHLHILIAAVESAGRYQVRLYSREKSLTFSNVQHTEQLASPAITTTVSGIDSLLVYTHDNTLLHYIIVMGSSTPKLVQVGQIGFHGIIRAPTRVRAISWILSEDQLDNGDPSQDVARATVLFLVDGKMVLLQPSTNEHGELKYDMRVIAHNVEYYLLIRDQPFMAALLEDPKPDSSRSDSLQFNDHLGHSLRDSLWYFEGTRFNVWSDIQDVMACAPAELGRELPPVVAVPVDFYPLSAVVPKGIVSGIDADLVQRRDIDFGFFRHAPRTQLFLPQLLRHHLGEYNSPAAVHLSNSYQHLPYFPHALEILLHDVLDTEVDNPPSPPEAALLPTVLAFLSSFGPYLDVVVNCTRKTELRSWRTLFSHLPPVSKLFEQSLAQGKLNTAAGYLLVLHAFEQDSFQVHEFGSLLRQAAGQHDWELCKELARFLVGIDASGETLASALGEAGLEGGPNVAMESSANMTPAVDDSGESNGPAEAVARPDRRSSQVNGFGPQGGVDYFSMNGRLRSEDDDTPANSGE